MAVAGNAGNVRLVSCSKQRLEPRVAKMPVVCERLSQAEAVHDCERKMVNQSRQAGSFVSIGQLGSMPFGFRGEDESVVGRQVIGQPYELGAQFTASKRICTLGQNVAGGEQRGAGRNPLLGVSGRAVPLVAPVPQGNEARGIQEDHGCLRAGSERSDSSGSPS